MSWYFHAYTTRRADPGIGRVAMVRGQSSNEDTKTIVQHDREHITERRNV
jgi:hypothetical protein